jgi:HEPN domain-containing protein
MKGETVSIARRYIREAQSELEFARRFPAYCCDVCGPYGHTFHACQIAAEKAIRGFLYFHNHQPVDSHNLKELVSFAAGYLPDFDSCIEKAISLDRYADFNREPSKSELAEALTLAAQILALVESRIPEDGS